MVRGENLFWRIIKSAAVGGLFMFWGIVSATNTAEAGAAAIVKSPYVYNFDQDGVLKEAPSIDKSTSPYWWLNSGAYLPIYGGRGHTNQGDLVPTDPWYLLYLQANPIDTDNGVHPQNIFRLLTRSTWQNAREEALFIVNKDNLSPSPSRDASNGLLLFSRYQDSDNTYYAGIRVDGAAVIKKKQNGIYTTLAYVKGIYPGTYNRDSNPNLLPKNKWIGLRSETVNNPDGSVSIKLYLDKGWSGKWQLVAEAKDVGTVSGPPITTPGYGGIRTDFMDVTFENFRLTNL